VPTYSYACTECDNRFDAVQSFSDEALTVCPNCQGKLRKLFNSVGVVFKGSGFYRTDSRSGGSSTDTAKKDTAPKSETKSDGAAKSTTAAKVEKATSSAGS
jgi:putative FmdB family regulatory protein